MRSAKTLLAAAITLAAAAGAVTGVAAAASGSPAPTRPAAAGHPGTAHAGADTGHARPNPLTGYPDRINTIDLNGYQIETSYPLGKLDAGSTYRQTYTHDTVTAVAIKGPYAGSPPVTYGYVAMPVTRDIVLLVWLEPNSQHNTFVYDFKDHESSVVTYDQAGDPSLGSVFVVKAGSRPIP